MGMRVGGSGAAWANQSNAVGNWQQRQQNMKALGTALQGGDLAAAQQAFATISANNPAAAANSNSPLAKIGQALQAGDLATAQQTAQAWRGGRHEGAGAQAAANANPLDNVNAATSTFLQTLTPIATTSSAATDASVTATTSSSGSSSSTSDQIAQALAAFEKNLFDSLQAQDNSGGAASTTTASATPAATTASDPTNAVQTAATAPPVTAPGHHHHHGVDNAKLGAELSSLIAQTSTASTDGSTTTSAPAAATSMTSLDQSFKTLLGTLGVSGNNASLNTFLQAMSANMQSRGAGIAPAAAVPTSA